jgi:hypothetical protein
LKHVYADGVCKLCGEEEPQGLPGDADGNGILDYLDAVLILRASVGLYTLDPVAEALSDVNRNGTVDYLDAVLILRASVGLITL